MCRKLPVSERRACRVLGQPRSTQRYEPRVAADIDEMGNLPVTRDETSFFFRLLTWPFEWAIFDRLLHHATTINIKGENYWLKETRKAGLPGRSSGRKEEGKENQAVGLDGWPEMYQTARSPEPAGDTCN